MKERREIKSDEELIGESIIKDDKEVVIPLEVLKEKGIDLNLAFPKYTFLDARSFFEQGAAWQREHQYMPHAMNAVKAHEEAVSRWKD